MSKRAIKQLQRLDRGVQHRLESLINSLADNPRPSGMKKLSGRLDVYRVRTGDYRVVYQIQDKQLVVLVLEMGHRREIYR